MKTLLKFVPIGILVVISSASFSVAADIPKEGKYDITSCFTRVVNAVNFSNTQSAASFEQTGVSLSNPPGGLFDKEAIRCVGLTGSFDGKNILNSVCEAVDSDGDKRLTHFYIGGDGKIVREAVAGTGKYDGMVTTGTYQVLGKFPVIKEGTSQFCNRQVGTYKLK